MPIAKSQSEEQCRARDRANSSEEVNTVSEVMISSRRDSGISVRPDR
nr:MAG TPA: hypothetical protein [Caudoviricetes sp.]